MISSPLDLFPPIKNEQYFKEFLELARDHPFEPNPPAAPAKFSRVNAWWLAEASLLAYHEPEFISSLLNELNLSVKPLGAAPSAESSTQGFTASGKDFAITAFRGTQIFLPGRDPLKSLEGVLADVLTDARTGLVLASPGSGRVHPGFLKAINEVSLEELQEATEVDGRKRALWLTGHSLGGALAILAAARLRESVTGVYVYGAPNVGDEEFGKSLRLQPVRFVHASDPVAVVPPTSLPLPLIPPKAPPQFGHYHELGEVVPFKRVEISGDSPGGFLHFAAHLLDKARDLPLANLIDHAPLLYTHHFRATLGAHST